MKTEESRVCTNCGKEMTSGYVIEDGLEYFCDDECLAGWYSKEEYMEMYEQGAAYWTDWNEQDEMPELKNCPFCPSGKGEYQFKYMEVNGYSGTAVRVRCDCCHAQSPYKRNAWLHGWHETLEDAADAWNRRREG